MQAFIFRDSSKDAGDKVTTITEVSDRQVYHPIVDALLLNPDAVKLTASSALTTRFIISAPR